MSNVIDLTDLYEYKLRKLEETIVDGLSHPDPEVLKIWTEMARDTIRKFPGGPEPSKSSIAMTPKDLEPIILNEQVGVWAYVDPD